jgi:hypothetical protein
MDSPNQNSRIKVLSVRQPWAWAMFHAQPEPKDIENRSWRVAYRGSLYIHASGSKATAKDLHTLQLLTNNVPESFVYSAILGRVKMVGCVSDSFSRWADPGCWHWQFIEPEAIAEPLYCKGSLSLWMPAQEISSLLLRSQFCPVDARGA